MFKVHGYRIIGTPEMVWEVYEPYDGHSTIQHFGSKRYGRLGTRPLPSDLEAMAPRSDERLQAVATWQARQYAQAYDLIDKAMARYGIRDHSVNYEMGTITYRCPRCVEDWPAVETEVAS